MTATATPPLQASVSLIGLIASDSKFINEREEITEYVKSLKAEGGS